MESANIAAKSKDGYLSIFLANDGFESWTGYLLLTYYNNQEEVEKLMARGDLDVLVSDPASSPQLFEAPTLHPDAVSAINANQEKAMYCYYWDGERWQFVEKSGMNASDIEMIHLDEMGLI